MGPQIEPNRPPSGVKISCKITIHLGSILDRLGRVLGATSSPANNRDSTGEGRGNPMEGGRGEVPFPLDLDFRRIEDEDRRTVDGKRL